MTHRSTGLPGFLDLPARGGRPRSRGITHVLDKGLTPAATEAFLGHVAPLVDIVKIGWGIGYVDPALRTRVALMTRFGCGVSFGGTLTEIAAAQGRVAELRAWALDVGITHLEVSDGLCRLAPRDKRNLIEWLAADFVVLAETGAKEGDHPATPRAWADEMAADLDAGATWLVAEGRESGTTGLYRRDQAVREDLVDAILARVPLDRVVFEAPVKAQQTWFVRRLGAEVNLGNIEPAEVLPLETLRLGLRADTACEHADGPPVGPAREHGSDAGSPVATSGTAAGTSVGVPA